MKKVFSLFVVLTFAASIAVFSQPNVTIGTVGPTASPADVPVTASDFGGGVYAFNLYIDFDPILQFQGHNSLASQFNSPSFNAAVIQPGLIEVAYSSFGSPLVDGLLFNLRFATPVIGTYSLTFDSYNDGIEEKDTELLDAVAADIESATFTDGAVTFDSPSVPLSNWAIFIGLGLIIAFLVVRFRRIV